jgi:GTPase SAR1 family protein
LIGDSSVGKSCFLLRFAVSLHSQCQIDATTRWRYQIIWSWF